MSKSKKLIKEKYFAVEAKHSELLDRLEEYQKQLEYTGYVQKISDSYSQYYGVGYDARTDRIKASGSQGEETRLSVNTYRNLLRYQLSLVTSERPSFDVVPTNTDYDSEASALVGKDILEYYLKVEKVEDVINDAVEKSIWSSEGYVALQWDALGGEIYAMDPDSGDPVREGQIKYSTYHLGEVARDIEQEEPAWIILKDTVNKFELAARFPEHAEEILESNEHEYPGTGSYNRSAGSDQVINLYTFYHDISPALPHGKMVLFTDTTKLLDIALPYPEIPVYRISPAILDGTNLGYAQAFDILAMQEVNDDLYSAVVSNNINFSKQCIIAPKDGDFNYRDLVDGLALIEVDEEVNGQVRPLQLTQSSPETYNLIGTLEEQMEKMTGINQVIRGEPEANLRSGNALALIAAQSIKYNSTLQQEAVRLVEKVGTATLKFLQHFAQTPRTYEIVGKANRYAVKSFTAEDLAGVSRVSVELGSPLMRTVAGRVQIADNLLQQGLVQDPEQYLAVITTGKLEPVYDSQRTERLNINSENEQMRTGTPVQAIITDRHELHIREHRSVLDNPEARKQPEVVQAVLAHIAEHEEQWAMVSQRPAILAATRQQPSPGGAPMPQQGSNQQVMNPNNAAPDPALPNLPNVPPAASPQDQMAMQQLNLQQP